jgi:hypothetical protein
MNWPTHGSRGRYDWATCIERDYADPFREGVRTSKRLKNQSHPPARRDLQSRLERVDAASIVEPFKTLRTA